MSQLKFSGFTLVSSVEENTSYFVGYDSALNDNIRFLQSSILLQGFGGSVQAATQVNFGSLAVTQGVVAKTPYNIADLANVSAGTTIIVESAYDLGGTTLALPANCVLKFNEAGAITNGTLTLDSTYIDASEGNIGILNGITIGGTYRNSAIHPEWFGSTAANYYWQTAIQAALDTAFLQGAKVKLSEREYQTQSKIVVRKGVTLEGVSSGERALGSGPTKGTRIRCVASNQLVIEVAGAFARLRDIFILGDSRFSGTTDGVLLNAVGDGVSVDSILENVELRNIVIHSCNVGLNLKAGNNGAVVYSSFINCRTRDCNTHVLIEGLSAKPSYGNLDPNGNPYTLDNAFVNSNYWQGYYASGWAQCGVKIVTQIKTNQVNQRDVYIPCNNLVWNGAVIEPSYTQYGHLVLQGGGGVVRMHDIRIEASTQASNYDTVPVVFLDERTEGCYISLDAADVPIVDKGTLNTIYQKNRKNANPSPNSDNLYINSAMTGLTLLSDNTTYTLPGGWLIDEQFTGTGAYSWRALTTTSPVTVQYSSTERMTGYKALEFTVPPQYQLRMFQPISREEYLLNAVTVNAYVQATNRNDVQWTYQDEKTSVLASGGSFGNAQFSGGWEPIGGTFYVRDVNDVNFYRIRIFCQNLNPVGGDDITFKVTQPQFVKGQIPKVLPNRYVTERGGTFFGTVGRSIVTNILPVTDPSTWTDGTNHLLLPHDGNYFEIAEAFTIQRINSSTNRFPSGSEITLMFTTEGSSVVDGSFISLNSPFESIAGSTITLFSKAGDGTWEEISRSSSNPLGISTVEVNDVIDSSNNRVNLDTESGNYFNLTNNVQANTVQRLNWSPTRFKAGREIFLRFQNINFPLTFTNSGFLNLNNTDFSPSDNDWIKLISDGSTWNEIARRPPNLTYATKGYNTYLIQDVVNPVNNRMALPTDGSTNIFGLDASTTAGTIQRINSSSPRFSAGTIILLEGTDVTQGITIVDGGYIGLLNGNNFTFAQGDVLALFTVGNGVWKEAWRYIA